MNYLKAVNYLNSFINYEKKTHFSYRGVFKLERVKEFLHIIGNPQSNLKCLHVAGTKGKGSVCAFSAYILRELGYKVGLYTSPHLICLRERIRVLPALNKAGACAGFFEGIIPEKDLADLVSDLSPRIDKYSKGSDYGRLSFFEVLTVLALEYFKRENVDFAVLETGLGGRLDATNAVDSLIAGISSISYDHTDKLGNTLSRIAFEKAGIIKKNQVVFSAPQEKEAKKVIKNKCLKENAVFYEIGRDISIKRKAQNPDFQEFSIDGITGRYGRLKIKLLGWHQIINAALAVGLVWGLEKRREIKINKNKLKAGLYRAVWPARFQVIAKSPGIIIDGAHNAASAKALIKTIKEVFPGKKSVFILGISKDKDIKGICREISSYAHSIILTKADNIRAAEPRFIKKFVKLPKIGTIEVTENLAQALTKAKARVKQRDIIVITGSLFLIGDVYQTNREPVPDPIRIVSPKGK